MDDLPFNPARLTLARRRRGLSKVALAEIIGVSSRRLAAYENQGERPPEGMIDSLARALEMPPAFFTRPSPPEPSSDGVSFRSFARLSAAHRDAALAAATIAFEFAELVGQELELPGLDLPDVRDIDPKTAATAVRSEWALGDLPMPNIVHLVESRGCRVFSLVDDVSALDAFSMWDRGTPFIFLTHHKSPERARWDVSHELAHVLLHVGSAPQGRENEQAADEFAAELLLPTDGVLERASRYPSMIEVRREKLYWRVSALAYIRRLYQLGCITERRYKSLIIEATQAGYRREEGDIDRELSGLWPKAFEIFREDGLTLPTLAQRLGVHPREIRELTFSALSARSGGSDTGSASSLAGRPTLRLV
jgi:Zn-dependent peptidase ImmA (M78 family)/transcriptional regulator with XRE-family HTH domain